MDNYMHYTVDAGPDILGKLANVLGIFLTGKVLVMAASTIAIVGLTFSILDMFTKGALFELQKHELGEKDKKSLGYGLFVIIITLAPIIVILPAMFSAPQNILKNSFHFIVAILASIILCWISSLMYKLAVKDGTKGQLLLGTAIKEVATITSHNIAVWVAKLFMAIINLIIKIVHIPFIANYFIMATIINLILSFILIGVVGISKESGAANMLGSLIGQALHALVRRNMINELRLQYEQQGAENA